MDFPELTREEKLCCSSIQDLACSLAWETDVDFLMDALQFERENYNRVTAIKKIESRIRQVKNRRIIWLTR